MYARKSVKEVQNNSITKRRTQPNYDSTNDEPSRKPNEGPNQIRVDERRGDGQGDSRGYSTHEEDDGKNNTLHPLRRARVSNFIRRDIDEYLRANCLSVWIARVK